MEQFNTPKVNAILILLSKYNDAAIARLVGASREYVRQIRKKYNIPLEKSKIKKHFIERKENVI